MALAYTEISKNKFRTWVLFIFFYLFVLALGYFFGEMFENGLGLGGLGIAGVAALIWMVIVYFKGAKITLKANGAVPIKKKDNPQLYNLVENLSIAAGLPTPEIYIMRTNALNAFATGRDPEHAVVAVTTGLLETLNKKELEGVLAHELSHIGNYDIRWMMMVGALAGVVLIMSDVVARVLIHGGGGRRGDARVKLVMFLVALAILLLAPLFASLIKLAISRKREYLADASGALLTRYPEGLASALEKISGDHHKFSKANKGSAHLYISNPFTKGAWSNLFSTHPPIEKRIEALRGMDV